MKILLIAGMYIPHLLKYEIMENGIEINSDGSV